MRNCSSKGAKFSTKLVNKIQMWWPLWSVCRGLRCRGQWSLFEGRPHRKEKSLFTQFKCLQLSSAHRKPTWAALRIEKMTWEQKASNQSHQAPLDNTILVLSLSNYIADWTWSSFSCQPFTMLSHSRPARNQNIRASRAHLHSNKIFLVFQ